MTAPPTSWPERPPPLAFALLFLLIHAPLVGVVWPITADSAHYLGIAHALATTGRAVDPLAYLDQARPVTDLHWPPLLPALIALLTWLGLTGEQAARSISLLGGAATAALGALAAGRLTRGPSAWLTALAITLLPGLTRASLHIWSEAPAAALALATLLLLDRSAERQRPWLAIGAALTLAAGVGLRWAGIALLPSALHALRRQPRGCQLAFALTLLAGLAPLLPFAAGDPPRLPAEPSVQALGGAAKVWLGFTLAGGLLPLLHARLDPATPPPGTLLRHGLFAVTHLGLLLLAQLSVRIDAVDLRLLLPATPSALLLAVGMAAALPHRPSLPRPVVIAGLLACAMAPMLTGLSIGPRGTETAAATATLAPALLALPAGTELWTDAPELTITRPDLQWRLLQAAPNAPWQTLPADTTGHALLRSGGLVEIATANR